MEKYKPTILYREGTTQSERFPQALAPEYVRIDERSLIDLVKQSAEYAQYVRYYSGSSTNDSQDDWSGMFNEIYDYQKKQVRFSSIEELEEKSSVSPHVALFLVFLRIFGIAQDNLNTLKEKHLDFYYREILGIAPREAQPDTVPLFFESNKSVNRAIVPAGTVFEAGKDALGKPLLYATKNDLIVNRAKIEAIKGIYKIDGKWFAADDMLNHCKADNKIEDHFLGVHCDKSARLGLAIASPLFDLPDGDRLITLDIENTEGFNVNSIEAEYTSEKGWIKCEILTNKTKHAYSAKITEIIIIIEKTDPPVTRYNEKIHGAGLNACFPVIRLLVTGDNNVVIKGIRTEVKGSKALKLSNKYGELNINKPFLPFGMQACKREQMQINYPAIFNNNNITYRKLNIEWNNTKWSGVTSSKSNTLDSDYLTLINDFGNSTYTEDYAKAAIDYAKDQKTPLPAKPEIPEIKSLTIDYNVSLTPLTNNGEHTFYHLYPFGWEKAVTFNLLPDVFTGEGALLFGISGMDKPGILSLYLQLSNYGANFAKEIKKENNPVWRYLKGNSWVKFRNEDIQLNSTNGFAKSGMVYLNIPEDAFGRHSIMPEDTPLWLMLLFGKDNDAYPLLDGADTQAVEAVFTDDGNDLSHLETCLPAGTITKPQTIIPGIRTVKQTYPSAGGRAPEKDKAYYTRVSEQLRHKGRAWNIWDYERLILEQFPALYKVKCVPYYQAKEGYFPGSIVLILLPDCKIIPQKNVLQPVVTQAIISDVTEFIASRCSEFVSLAVANPVYECISVKCEVAFVKGSDEDFYKNRLNEDLKRFLSPWTDTTGEILFNKSLTNAQIIYFIEKRPYVDYIKSLSVSVELNGNTREMKDNDTIQSSSPDAMLTSAETHIINSKH